jgi:ribosome biogenesis SPOUT family RNA methylase Rps3
MPGINIRTAVGLFGKTKEFGMKLARATKLIYELRSELDDILFDEYPDLETKEGCKYYY